MKQEARARAALVAAAVCGGATYPVIHASVRAFPPTAFALARFLLAAGVLLPFAAGGLGDRRARHTGAALGLLEGTVGALVAVFIADMPASRCAFIMGTSVVWVPLWAALLGRQAPRATSLAACALSLGGLLLLTGGRLAHLGRAEAAILLAAALWALNIVLVRHETRRHGLAPAPLAFWQALSNALVPALAWVAKGCPLAPLSASTLAGLAYCSGVATVLNLVIQATYQRHTTSTQAALRLALEPLFATLIAALALGDRVGPQALAGGALMAAATLLPELAERRRRPAQRAPQR